MDIVLVLRDCRLSVSRLGAECDMSMSCGGIFEVVVCMQFIEEGRQHLQRVHG